MNACILRAVAEVILAFNFYRSGAANYTNFVYVRGVCLIITLGKVVVNRQYSNE